MDQRLQRWLPATTLAVSFSLMALIFVFGDPAAYRAILWHMGIQPFYFPFLDAHGVLSTAQCHRLGFDVLVRNPCDVLGRKLDYSPFWLIMAKFGLGTTATIKVGLCLDVLFLIWVFFLPPVRGWTSTAVLTVAMLSSAVALALERANLDLAIFVIGLIAVNWSFRSPAWRFSGYGLVVLAALVKYYPGVMLVLALRERPRVLVTIAALLAAAAALFFAIEGTELTRALRNIETGTRFTNNFGAVNLPGGLVSLFSGENARLAAILELFCAAGAVAYAVATARLDDLRGALATLSPRRRAFMLMGSALIAACFFAAQNVPYRGIYFLFILPGLMELRHAPLCAGMRRRMTVLSGVILFLLWGQFFQLALEQGIARTSWPIGYPHFVFWLAREAMWWWTVSILMSLLLSLIEASPAGEMLLKRVGFASRPSASSI